MVLLTHQFILGFLQATENLPEDIQREIFTEIVRGTALSPPLAPRQALRPLNVFRCVKPRNLFF